MAVAFYVPVLVAVLSVIPAFFIARRIGGNLGGFFAAMIVAIHASFLTRTPAGFADTDGFNVTFPLFIIWMLIESFYAKNTSIRILWSAGSGCVTGIYAYAWGGWWYIFDFAIISLVAYIGYQVVLDWRVLRKPATIIKNTGLMSKITLALTYVVSSGIFVSLTQSFSYFISAPTNPLWFSTLKDVATTTLWPNVFTTVAELNPAKVPQIISSGGALMKYEKDWVKLTKIPELTT